MTPAPMPPSGGAAIALFIAGGTPRSAAAMRNLSMALDSRQLGCAAPQVEIVDVLRDPGAALAVGLLATPSLSLTLAGGPRRWFVGDLSRSELLANWLADRIGSQADILASN